MHMWDRRERPSLHGYPELKPTRSVLCDSDQGEDELIS